MSWKQFWNCAGIVLQSSKVSLLKMQSRLRKLLFKTISFPQNFLWRSSMQLWPPFQKKIFFLNFHIYFFSKEFVYPKMSVWTSTMQFWHHSDNLFAQFLNLIVTLFLLQLQSTSAEFSTATVRMQFWQLCRKSPGNDVIILIHSEN